MSNLGIIDIGSNSMRLVIIQVRKDGSFKIIDELKESVRLGENTNDTNVLGPTKMEIAIDTLRFFRNLCDALHVKEIVCVATEAVRKAANQDLFVEMVEEQVGLTIGVISGIKEAYYDYFGTVNSLDHSNALIMDIGGSSTELIRIKDRKIENSVSLPFGSITLTQMFHLGTKVKDQDKKALHKFLQDHYSKLDWLDGNGPLIGIGGSFRNIGKVDRILKNYPLDMAHNYPVSSSSLVNIYEMVSELSCEERKEIKGLSKDRADIIPGALGAISVLLGRTGIKDVVISGSGVREGLIYEQILQSKQPVKDVLDFSLQNIMNNYELNQAHARHVWEIFRKLYDQLKEEFRIGYNQYKVLKTAALLHDCGINISYYGHHKHSFYTILNSRVNGLTQKELIMAAWVASLHRKEEAKITAPFRGMLDNEEIRTVQKLGILLRLAESLDRRQNGNIYEIKTEIDKDSVKIKVSARINPSLEIKDALSVVSNFKKVFKRQLQIMT